MPDPVPAGAAAVEAVHWTLALDNHLRAIDEVYDPVGSWADVVLAARYLLAHAHVLVPVADGGGVLRWAVAGGELPPGEGPLVWGRAAYRDQFEPLPVAEVLGELAELVNRPSVSAVSD